jgi:hypothetical protein
MYNPMATIGSANSSSYENTSRRSYISAAPFQDDIWAYTTSVNPTTYVTIGTLTKLSAVPGSGANAGTCPPYRVVRETGRKLYPTSNPGVATYLVEVFDSMTFLRGYINPNSPIFAAFNSDKPAFLEAPYDANRDVSGGSYNTGNFTGVDNWGQSIVTHGNIIMDGYIDALGQIRCSNQITIPSGASAAVDVIQGQVFYRDVSATLTLTASNYSVGDRVTLLLNFTGTPTVTFSGTNFRTLTGAITPSVGGGLYSLSFIVANLSVGARLVETSRIGPLTFV